MDTSEFRSEIKAWREVHARLTEAVIVAKEAVAAAKAQRRYWLEEIAANLTPEGKLTAASIWKKPSKVKAVVKRKSLPKAMSKRKKSDDTETDEDEPPAKKKKIVRQKAIKAAPKKVKLNLTHFKAHAPDEDDEDMDESTSSALEVSGYSMNEQEAAAALLSGASGGGDMSHIPEELRPFMAMDVGGHAEEVSQVRQPMNSYGGKTLRAYNYDDDEDEGDDDIEDDEDD
ncbi:hypothetical protein MHU86_17615 [Fragilaria crotonensis]|nr:hypothetical protein MHU86_17615 [Fragilaria crotonensis]